MVNTIFILDKTYNTTQILVGDKSSQRMFWDDLYTQEFDTGTETFEFSCYLDENVIEGNYVAFYYNNQYKLFSIMEIEQTHKKGRLVANCYCEIASLSLLNNYVREFSGEMNCIQFFEHILDGTDWHIGKYSTSLIDRVEAIKVTKIENVWSLIEDYKDIFECEINVRVTYENGHVTGQYIDIYSEGGLGSPTLKRFEYGRNVTGITKKKELYDWCTGVILDVDCDVSETIIEESDGYGFTKGAGDIILNDNANRMYNAGKNYVIGVYEGDETEPVEACINAWEELKKRSVPRFDYEVTTALTEDEYEEVHLGDTVYVVDRSYTPPLFLEARVGKLELSFTDRTQNKCVLTNYKEIKSKLLDADYIKLTGTISDIVNAFFPITSEGIADGAIVDGKIDTVYYQQITADIVSAGIGAFEELYAQGMTVINADIENLKATNADIDNLKAKVAEIDTLINGHLTSDNIQSLILTADKVTVADAFIKNAMIDTISANKITAGRLNTSLVDIQSEDGGVQISGSLQQFRDSSGKVRIQIGKDANGDFTFALFSQDGVGVLIDENGIKEGAIGDGLIVDDMVSDNANIQGGKLDINSVITSINNGTTTINSNRIYLDEEGQSLKVAFDQLKTKVETIEDVTVDGDLSSIIEQVTSNTTNINVMQGEISSLISNTTITKQNGEVVQLKDEYNSTKATVDSLTTKIGSLETTVDSVSSKQASMELDLNGFETTVSKIETQSLTNYNNLIINSAMKNSKMGWYSNNIDLVGITTTTSTKLEDNHSIRLDCRTTPVYVNSTRIKVNPGDTYTIGMWGLCAEYNDYLRVYSLFCETDALDNSYTSSPIVMSYYYSDSPNWQYKTATFTIPEGTKYLSIKVRGQSTQTTNDYDGRCWFSCLMLCRGNVVGSWTDNSNDNYHEFSTRMKDAELKITDEAIISTVSSTYATKAQLNTTNSNVTTAQNTANTAQSTANSALTKANTNASNITSVTSKYSSLEQDVNKFKTTVSSTYATKAELEGIGGVDTSNFVTKTEFEQTSEDFTFKISQAGGGNFLRNSSFLNAVDGEYDYWNFWGNASQYTDILLLYAEDGIFVIETSSTSSAGGFYQQNLFLEPNSTYTFSTFVSWNDGISAPTIAVEFYDSSNNRISSAFLSASSMQDTRQHVTFTTPTNIYRATVTFNYSSVYNTSSSQIFIKYPCLVKGYGTEWVPHPSEIYDGIVKIDMNGLTVQHNNSKSVLDSEALKFYEGNTLYSRIEEGKFKFTDSNGTNLGRVGYSWWKDAPTKALSTLQATYGHSVALSTPYEENADSSIVGVVHSSHEHWVSDDMILYQGLNLAKPTICGMVNIKPGWTSTLQKYNDVRVGHLALWGYDDSTYGYIGLVAGNNILRLGVLAGATMKTGLSLYEDSSYNGGVRLALGGPLQMNGWNMMNARSTMDLNAQSRYTKSLLSEGTNEHISYGTLSYSDNEIRWCWKENVFTYQDCDVDPVTDEWVYLDRYICYIELPIFMAENIEADYHINVSKMSWGDWRIREKNQYYFILESEENDFAFTFEVVAKLKDGSTIDTNAYVANDSVSELNTEIPQDFKDLEIPINNIQEDINIGEE